MGLTPLITQAAFADMKVAMKDPSLRFWAVEHLTMMLVAWIAARVGAIVFKKGTEPKAYRMLLIFGAVQLVAILAAIPWPARAVGRELFRLGF